MEFEEERHTRKFNGRDKSCAQRDEKFKEKWDRENGSLSARPYPVKLSTCTKQILFNKGNHQQVKSYEM